MRTRTVFALALTALLAGPALAGEGKHHEKSRADLPPGWTLSSEDGRLIAERYVERVAGEDARPPASALRLAVRAAIVNNAILDAEGIDARIQGREVTLTGDVQDRATLMRTIEALAEIRQLDRIESRLSVR